jgi:hypothetical protein
MRIISKPLILKDIVLGDYVRAYTDVEPELVATEPMTRVLPAPFFHETSMTFYLKRRWEPGENKWFKDGGFEVFDSTGATRSYELDQVIKHPSLLKMKKYILEQDENAVVKEVKQAKVKTEGGKRGRPGLSNEEQAIRDAAKAERNEKSSGRRGRPAGQSVPKQPKAANGGRRGRPGLSEVEKAARELANTQRLAKSGGKRGRPKK